LLTLQAPKKTQANWYQNIPMMYDFIYHKWIEGVSPVLAWDTTNNSQLLYGDSPFLFLYPLFA